MRHVDSCEPFAAEPAFLQSVVDKGERLRSGLAEALKGNEHVKEIRGLGLITGIQLDQVGASEDGDLHPDQLAVLV